MMNCLVKLPGGQKYHKAICVSLTSSSSPQSSSVTLANGRVLPIRKM